MVSRLRHRGDAVCRHLPPAQPFRTSVLPRRLACRISPLDKPIHCMNYLFYEEFTRSPNRGGPLLPPARLPRPPPVRGSPRLFRRRYLFPTGRRTIRLFSRLLSCSLQFSATTSAAPSLISSATSNPVPAANPRKTPSASSSWPCASRIFPSMTSSDP